MNYEEKVQMYQLSDALVRNVNDNFINVSFQILENGYIQVKIILEKITDNERDYIDDLAAEFSAVQIGNIVNKIEVTTDKNAPSLKNIVYSKLIND